MSNQSDNAAAVNKYRDELRAMCEDISRIDRKVLTQAVDGVGLPVVKKETPVDTGTLRKGWNSPPVRTSGGGIEKSLENNVEYASYVNDGHRVVNRARETVGYVEGRHFLERAVNQTEAATSYLFQKEVERVNRKYDK